MSEYHKEDITPKGERSDEQFKSDCEDAARRSLQAVLENERIHTIIIGAMVGEPGKEDVVVSIGGSDYYMSILTIALSQRISQVQETVTANYLSELVKGNVLHAMGDGDGKPN